MAIKQKQEEKQSKLWEILKKDYKWESYVFFAISLLVLLLGVLILTGTLTISPSAPLIGGFPTVFAWILVVFGGLTLLYAVYPFFKPAFPELKKITWLKGKKYFGDVIRVFSFIIVFALLFLLYDMFITEILAKIMG